MTAPTEAEAEVVATLRAAGCVFAEDEADLLLSAAQDDDQLAVMMARRVSGVPLEHVLGYVDFCGFRMHVTDGVFVPRRRTELMVEEAADLVASVVPAASAVELAERAPVVIADLCCGSGAVGAALARRLQSREIAVNLYAADVDQAAVRCAQSNVAPVGGLVLHGDLYAPLPASLRGRIDVIVANAPYVPTGSIAAMPPEARLHEPRVALDGGVDGLDVQRRVIAEAPEWLSPKGWLLVETSDPQAPHTALAFEEVGLDARVVHDEERDATVVIGSRPGTAAASRAAREPA